MSTPLFIVVCIVGAFIFACLVALFLGCVLWIAAREDRLLQEEADTLIARETEELERILALPTREPVRR